MVGWSSTSARTEADDGIIMTAQVARYRGRPTNGAATYLSVVDIYPPHIVLSSNTAVLRDSSC